MISVYRATHSVLTEVSTGVLWVLTGTHPCDTSTQAGWWRYQSASSYVRGYVSGILVHVVARERVVFWCRAVWFPHFFTFLTSDFLNFFTFFFFCVFLFFFFLIFFFLSFFLLFSFLFVFVSFICIYFRCNFFFVFPFLFR